jgi:hypothetical protein
MGPAPARPGGIGKPEHGRGPGRRVFRYQWGYKKFFKFFIPPFRFTRWSGKNRPSLGNVLCKGYVCRGLFSSPLKLPAVHNERIGFGCVWAIEEVWG